MVDINVELKVSSENLWSIHVLPTPLSPVRRSLKLKSYVLAIPSLVPRLFQWIVERKKTMGGKRLTLRRPRGPVSHARATLQGMMGVVSVCSLKMMDGFVLSFAGLFSRFELFNYAWITGKRSTCSLYSFWKARQHHGGRHAWQFLVLLVTLCRFVHVWQLLLSYHWPCRCRFRPGRHNLELILDAWQQHEQHGATYAVNASQFNCCTLSHKQTLHYRDRWCTFRRNTFWPARAVRKFRLQ